MCRDGQFGQGRKLCVGLALDAFKDKVEYNFKIGQSDTIYNISKSDILVHGDQWYSKKSGNMTVIIPLEKCNQIKKKEEECLSM